MEHDIQINASDHASAVFKKMFPNSKIEQKYECGQTKTLAIINIMAETSQQHICSRVEKVAIHSSIWWNNVSASQLYPKLLTYYDDIVETNYKLN